MQSLAVDRYIETIVAHVRAKRRAIIVAPPGSGKTTRIPPALAAIGRTILLQPRRVAARALSRRIASERQWTLGDEIGWHIRFERRFSDRTQLIVATEGILTARLQSDPLLSDFRVVILDEFHERSIHADLALALAKQAADSRDDLAIVVMSATLDTKPLVAFLDAEVITIDARQYPIEVRYAPGVSVTRAVRDMLPTTSGHVLCFLPGAREIENTIAELGDIDARVLPLHGSLDVDAQEVALAPSEERKVIVATNVAETSLTVEGVTDVVDSGLHKVLRYDSETAVDHLVTERITADSADQRAGRAGRTAPGRATRLWDSRSLLHPHREPEIRRVDLASPALDIIAWGGDPQRFEWFERPQEDRITSALELLAMIGATHEGKLTAAGELMRAFPLHPRLARVVIAANGADQAIRMLVDAADQIEIARVAKRNLKMYSRTIDDESLRRAILAGFPDRVAMRRSVKTRDVLLATGTGARLGREIEHPADFMVALEVRGDIVHRAIPIERDWLAETRREQVEENDGDSIRTIERRYYMNILLHEQQIARRAAPKKRVEMQRRGPESLQLPSGRSVKLEYRDDGSIFASAKLQELFGLGDSPQIDGTPVTFQLLAPNGRPVQVTRDLRSFWNNTYNEVRKELRGRYPKHPWPDDPWTAAPTHKTKKSS